MYAEVNHARWQRGTFSVRPSTYVFPNSVELDARGDAGEGRGGARCKLLLLSYINWCMNFCYCHIVIHLCDV
jgi:hypothetical protein